MQRINRKWRPPLALVIGGGLAGVLATPLIGIIYFRLWGDTLDWGEAALLVGGIALIVTVILGWLLRRLVLRPVYALTVHAKAVKAGQMNTAVPQHFGTPEFKELGQSVFEMGATLNSRAASVRAFTDHVTHELKSPLTSMRGAAELLRGDSLNDHDRAALLETIVASSSRMDTLLNDLRSHAIASQSAGAGSCVLSDAIPQKTEIQIQFSGNATVPLDRADLHAILVQLAQNAAAHGADKLTVVWDGEVMSISDNGSGVSQGNEGRIFDPFFTSRRDEGGTGMGLAIVRSLLMAQGAKIDLIESEVGAAFEIRFATQRPS
jgi:two-component system OmpR family sensor kinase